MHIFNLSIKKDLSGETLEMVKVKLCWGGKVGVSIKNKMQQSVMETGFIMTGDKVSDLNIT